MGRMDRLGRWRRIALSLALWASAGVESSRASAGAKRVAGVVNLNTASIETLALLPGIGPSRARDIVASRTRRPFRTVDELARVRGIGRRMLQAIRPNLAIAGPSTLKALPKGAPSPPTAAPTAPPTAAGSPAATKLKPIPACAPAARAPPGRRPSPAPPQSFANHCPPPP